jgi:hypothetical protein
VVRFDLDHRHTALSSVGQRVRKQRAPDALANAHW